MRSQRLALATCLLLLAGADPVRAQQPELERMLRVLAGSWAEGDAAAVANVSARHGLSLDLQGGPVGPLSPRQAAAVLRRVFDQRETVRVQVGMIRVVGNTPPHGFGELRWISRVRGTTIPEQVTVFFAVVREDDGWRVTQIRFLP